MRVGEQRCELVEIYRDGDQFGLLEGRDARQERPSKRHYLYTHENSIPKLARTNRNLDIEKAHRLGPGSYAKCHCKIANCSMVSEAVAV